MLRFVQKCVLYIATNKVHIYTDLVFPFMLTDFDRFVTVFSSVRTRTFLLFLFFTTQVKMISSTSQTESASTPVK